MTEELDLTKFIDGGDGISTIRTSEVFGGENFRGWNGIKYKTGLSAKNTSAEKLSMNVATVAPGAVAYAHICLLYTSPSPRDQRGSRMPSSA